MSESFTPPAELSLEEMHGIAPPSRSAPPAELSFDEMHGAPASDNGHEAGWHETIADTARGARATLPFAKDISAATRAYIGNPLTMTAPSSDFETEKRAIERQQDESWNRSPKAYATGATAGILAPGGPMAKIGKIIPAAETAIVSRAAPVVGEGIARTIGAAAPVTAAGAVLGAGEGATADERLSNALTGGAFGAAGGLAGDVAAPLVAGAGRTLDKFRAGVTPKTAKGEALSKTIRQSNPFAVTLPEAAKRDAVRLGLPAEGPISVEDLQKAAKAAYERADSHGVLVRPEALRTLHSDITSKLAEAGYHPRNAPELVAALDELKAAGSRDIPTTLKGADIIGRIANAATVSPNAQSRLHGGIFKGALDDFLQSLGPEHTLGGNGSAASSALKSARELWKRKSKTEALDALIEDVHNATEANHGSIDKRLRQSIDGLLKKARKQPGRWTPDELAAMRDVLHQGPVRSTARALGRFAPTQNPAAGVVELGTALMHSGWAPEAAAAAIASEGSKLFAHKATQARLKDLRELVTRGGRWHNVTRSSVADESKSRALLGTTLGQTAPSAMALREQRATGGKVSPQLTRIERAATRAQKHIASESRPLMHAPDALIAKALKVAADQ